MKTDHRGLAVLGLVCTVGGGALLFSQWLLPHLSTTYSGIGAFPLVIGLLLLGVAEEQWRAYRKQVDKVSGAADPPPAAPPTLPTETEG